MNHRLVWPIVFVACLAQVERPALAHHSALLANFDFEHPVTLLGTVAVFRLVNPHATIEFDVRSAAGALRRWSLELGSAASLRKIGWNEHTLEFGQDIEVVGAPAKDGSPSISGQHEARITLVESGASSTRKGGRSG